MRRCDTHDGVIPSVERDRPSHDIGVRSEAALPEAMTQNYHAWTAGTMLLGQEATAKDRRNTQHGEEVTGDVIADQPFGFFPTGEAEVPLGGHALEAPAGGRGHTLKAPALLSPVHEVRQRSLFSTDLRMCAPDDD